MSSGAAAMLNERTEHAAVVRRENERRDLPASVGAAVRASTGRWRRPDSSFCPQFKVRRQRLVAAAPGSSQQGLPGNTAPWHSTLIGGRAAMTSTKTNDEAAKDSFYWRVGDETRLTVDWHHARFFSSPRTMIARNDVRLSQSTFPKSGRSSLAAARASLNEFPSAVIRLSASRRRWSSCEMRKPSFGRASNTSSSSGGPHLHMQTSSSPGCASHTNKARPSVCLRRRVSRPSLSVAPFRQRHLAVLCGTAWWADEKRNARQRESASQLGPRRRISQNRCDADRIGAAGRRRGVETNNVIVHDANASPRLLAPTAKNTKKQTKDDVKRNETRFAFFVFRVSFRIWLVFFSASVSAPPFSCRSAEDWTRQRERDESNSVKLGTTAAAVSSHLIGRRRRRRRNPFWWPRSLFISQSSCRVAIGARPFPRR